MTILPQKDADPKLVCLTAYSMPMAARLAPHVDLLLVGDSLGMVLYGMDTTLDVTLEMMINHGKAVFKGAGGQVPVIIDMPYGTYEASADEALKNAKRIMGQTGAQGVKLEGGVDMAAQIAAITGAGIPVMGHIGLQPQSVVKEGGFKIKGRTKEGIAQLVADAKAVQDAGAFSMVLEGTLTAATHKVLEAATVPVIGIGAGAACDGQILVTDDMLGLQAPSGHVPKFVKHYAHFGDTIEQAAQDYASDVREGAFPAKEHIYD